MNTCVCVCVCVCVLCLCEYEWSGVIAGRDRQAFVCVCLCLCGSECGRENVLSESVMCVGGGGVEELPSKKVRVTPKRHTPPGGSRVYVCLSLT